MQNFICKNWSEVPKHLRTKTVLNNMGIYNLSEPCATVEIYNNIYKLYNINDCLNIERNLGNKSLVINSLTKSNYLIMEMTTIGKGKETEIIELVVIDLDGKLKYKHCFKSKKQKNISYHINAQISLWEKEWENISHVLKGKILLVPNTIYAKELIYQNCKNHGIEKKHELYVICSKPQIQKKLSILTILGIKKEQEVQMNPQTTCFDFLNIMYPKSKIYYMRKKAEIYFNKLCDYKERKGYKNAYRIGKEWLMKEYGLNTNQLNFQEFSYEICEEIINLIYPILKGLGILPKRIE